MGLRHLFRAAVPLLALAATSVSGSARAAELQSQATSGKAESPPGAGQGEEASLQEVVVTGYKFLSVDTSGTTNLPLPIEKVPQSISLVSNDFIQAANLKTLGEIAEYTAGAVNVGAPENFRSKLQLRGFTVGAGAVDGLPFSFAAEPDYAVFSRLEVVKGPSSVVYGEETPGGLVNFVTKDASPDAPSYLTAQLSSWEGYRVEAQGAGPANASGSVRLIGLAVYDQANSFVNDLYLKRPSLYGGIDFDIGGSIKGYLHGGWLRQEGPSFDGIPTFADGHPAPVPISLFLGDPAIVQAENVYYAVGDLTLHPTDMLEFNLKGAYSTNRVSGGQTFANGSIAPNGDVLVSLDTYSKFRDDTYSVGASTLYHFDSLGLKDSFVVASALLASDDNTGNIVYANSGIANVFGPQAAVYEAFQALLPPLYPIDGEAKSSTLTLSVQSLLKVLDPLSLLLGASYSKTDTKSITNYTVPPSEDFSFKGRMSYRAGVIYEAADKTNVYFSYSQSFLSQPVLLLDETVAPPATGDQYELGLKQRALDDRLLLTGAVYQIRENDIAHYAITTPAGINLFALNGQVTHRGLELAALGHITQSWQINAGYSSISAKITEDPDASIVGQTELFVPRETASLYTTYDIREGQLRGLSIGVGGRYVGHERTSYLGSNPPTADIPSYTLVDGFVGYSWNKWRIQLNAKNIFDRRYFISNYQTLIFGNQPGEPANIALSVHRTF